MLLLLLLRLLFPLAPIFFLGLPLSTPLDSSSPKKLIMMWYSFCLAMPISGRLQTSASNRRAVMHSHALPNKSAFVDREGVRASSVFFKVDPLPTRPRPHSRPVGWPGQPLVIAGDCPRRGWGLTLIRSARSISVYWRKRPGEQQAHLHHESTQHDERLRGDREVGAQAPSGPCTRCDGRRTAAST